MLCLRLLVSFEALTDITPQIGRVLLKLLPEIAGSRRSRGSAVKMHTRRLLLLLLQVHIVQVVYSRGNLPLHLQIHRLFQHSHYSKIGNQPTCRGCSSREVGVRQAREGCAMRQRALPSSNNTQLPGLARAHFFACNKQPHNKRLLSWSQMEHICSRRNQAPIQRSARILARHASARRYGVLNCGTKIVCASILTNTHLHTRSVMSRTFRSLGFGGCAPPAAAAPPLSTIIPKIAWQPKSNQKLSVLQYRVGRGDCKTHRGLYYICSTRKSPDFRGAHLFHLRIARLVAPADLPETVQYTCARDRAHAADIIFGRVLVGSPSAPSSAAKNENGRRCCKFRRTGGVKSWCSKTWGTPSF